MASLIMRMFLERFLEEMASSGGGAEAEARLH